jgi:uncharacterized membrane protein YoaK (UPF0700 family)/anti-anti-sigma regulatory factor
MFVAQAHSFTQKARLAVTLAWVAGYVNIVGIVVCGRAVSHVTGTVSAFGKDVADGDWALLVASGWLLWWFLAGAFASGMATDVARRRRWKSIYVLPMAVEAAVLSAFALTIALEGAPQVEGGEVLKGRAFLLATGFACFAMGLQNATITRISGGVVRTTHVTGVLTDLGLELVTVLRPAAPRRAGGTETPGGLTPRERAALLAAILAGFGLGAGLGGLVLARSIDFVMLPPVLFLAWMIRQDASQPVADLVQDPAGPDADAGLAPQNMAVFRLRCPHRRRGRPHRLPNMNAWAESLDPSVEVAVIDLSEAEDIEFAGAEELCLLAERFHKSGKSLVLAGVDPERFPSLHAAGLDRLMPLGSVSRDVTQALDFARERAWRLAVRSVSRPARA